jgi:hypothetical protein
VTEADLAAMGSARQGGSVPAELRRRPLWVTVPLYAVALFIIGLDLWAVAFWSAVGALIGSGIAIAGSAVALVLTALVATDARRQWLLGVRPEAEEA